MINCLLLKNNIHVNARDNYGDTVVQWICKTPLQGFSIADPEPIPTFSNFLEMFSKFEEMIFDFENVSRNS